MRSHALRRDSATRLHAGTRCADDIEVRVVGDVQHLCRLDPASSSNR